MLLSERNDPLFLKNTKEKSVTRATANIALENAVKLQKEGFVITGPKMLRCFGASYLYPVFIRIGVIQNGDKRI